MSYPSASQCIIGNFPGFADENSTTVFVKMTKLITFADPILKEFNNSAGLPMLEFHHNYCRLKSGDSINQYEDFNSSVA